MTLNRVGQRVGQHPTLYAATTLDHFLEPFDHDLGRCPLAMVMVQEGATFRRVDADYYQRLARLYDKAMAGDLPQQTQHVLKSRWAALTAAWLRLSEP